MIFWTTVTAVILLIVWVVFAFNRLVRLRNQMRNAWADIDVQLTRRHDLVPQLVTAVKAYAAHESAVLTAVTELRAAAMAQTRPGRLYEVESALEQALTRLFALKEAYPDLKASENFMKLHDALIDVENHLQYARRYYNGAVRDNNDAVQRIPDIVVARTFGFLNGEFYQADAGARSAINLDLS